MSPSDWRRFTEHPHITSEEAGPVIDANGKELWAGDPGFLEELGRQWGFKVVNLDEHPELADED